jgi:uncharacterized damage-inducible protein DinB
LLDQVSNLSQTQASRRPAADEWSVIEVLAHIADVDRFYLKQALAIRDEPGRRFDYFDDEAWKRNNQDARHVSLAAVIEAMPGRTLRSLVPHRE